MDHGHVLHAPPAHGDGGRDGEAGGDGRLAGTAGSDGAGVQGFGNVGSVAADLMAKEGAIIVAVSDKSGAVHNPQGLDIADMLTWVKEHRQLVGYPKGEPMSKEAVLTAECDV